jgi:OOP family OmpA-OmpF porin
MLNPAAFRRPSFSLFALFFLAFVSLFCCVVSEVRAQIDEGPRPHVEWASEVLDFSSQDGDKVHSANQALGIPNKYPATGDSPCAWLPKKGRDVGTMEEWIKVGFERPMKIQQVAIAENFYPGAIEKIILFDEHDRARDSVTYAPHFDGLNAKIAHWRFARTSYPVSAVEIVLQPGLVPGPTEIDAIAISDQFTEVKAEINVAPNVRVGLRENLGPAINSSYDELYPVIAPDGKTLFIVRRDHPQNFRLPLSLTKVRGLDTSDDNIWFSTQNGEGDWLPVKNIGPMLNNGYGSFVASVTPDGNTLLLGGSYRSKTAGPGSEHFGLWFTHRTTDGWTYPEEVAVKDYYTTSIYVEFCLSNDGRTIVLSLQRADSYGGKDLYVSSLQPDGSWSAPKNLGPTINSAADEATPFLASDGKTLYFASEGFAGYGDMDMYISRRLDSTWQRWSEPENLGPQLNTPGWDAYYTVPASGEYAYFVSTDSSLGEGDIFRVKLPQELRPEAVVLVKGKVLDAKTSKPVNAEIKYENLETGHEIGSARTSPTTGIYEITLPAGANYGYRAEAPGYIPVSENLDLTKADQYKELERDLTLVPLEKDQTIRMNNIFFETGKADLQPESFAELNRIFQVLHDNQSMEIEIDGHTDNVGPPAVNKVLSEARATSVQTYLTKKGIEAKRLRAKGFGENKPIASNNTDGGRQQNRRVEFTILKQ